MQMDSHDQYRPNGEEERHVEIPAELEGLVELLAQNVHDTWARGRIREGWTYGPERNDSLKQTPCLVPYDELPETEKEYDRRTALSTIRFILASGYKISK